jgi:hypothetical protein
MMLAAASAAYIRLPRNSHGFNLHNFPSSGRIQGAGLELARPEGCCLSGRAFALVSFNQLTEENSCAGESFGFGD